MRRRKVRDIRDHNHNEIVAFLKCHGMEVIETERPLDCLIFNGEEAGWMEIKADSRNASIKRGQLEFMSETSMPVAIVRNEGEALIFATTMEGWTTKEKERIAAFLWKDDRKVFYPATVEKVLNGTS